MRPINEELEEIEQWLEEVFLHYDTLGDTIESLNSLKARYEGRNVFLKNDCDGDLWLAEKVFETPEERDERVDREKRKRAAKEAQERAVLQELNEKYGVK